MRPTLQELLNTKEGSKLLILGGEECFTFVEIERFLKKFGVLPVRKNEEKVAGVIEHHRLNPIEEAISYEAYSKGLPVYKLEELELLISDTLVDDHVLMGLKLGNDQKRLTKLLGNAHISDTLFIKLLPLYRWSEDEEEESNDDRGVVTATLRRFLTIRPNEEDLLYSPLSLKRLILECTDPKLLGALLAFPNYRFMQKGKKRITLRECIAENPSIDAHVIERLIQFRDEGILASLAANPSVPLDILAQFAKKGREQICEALALNSAIDDQLFALLLEQGEEVRQLLLRYQPLDITRLEMIERQGADAADYVLIGANELLEPDVVFALLDREEPTLQEVLADNRSTPSEALTRLYSTVGYRLYPQLAANPSTPAKLLEQFYRENGDDASIVLALAANPSTPQAILEEIFAQDDFEYNKQLASNESLPLELLNILKVDTRLRSALASNRRFREHITEQIEF